MIGVGGFLGRKYTFAFDFGNRRAAILKTNFLEGGKVQAGGGFAVTGQVGYFTGSIKDLKDASFGVTVLQARGAKGIAFSASVPESGSILSILGGRIPDGSQVSLGASAGFASFKTIGIENTEIQADISSAFFGPKRTKPALRGEIAQSDNTNVSIDRDFQGVLDSINKGTFDIDKFLLIK